jgi:organic radical activating enzyme
MLQYDNAPDYIKATAHYPHIEYLETMVTYACTLSCTGCTNYSDYNMRGGYVRWNTAKPWLDMLFDRMRIDCFGLIGGEPFLNPELETWIREFKTNYPFVTLMISTNGQLFHKNTWILDCMEQYGMIYLKLSNQIPGAEYFQNAIDTVLKRFAWQKVQDKYFYQEKILDFEISSTPKFLKTYRGNLNNMKPYNNDPVEAFEICTQKICPLLENGKLYKCSSVGLLHRVLKDHKLLDDSDWQKYLNTGLDLTCTDTQLQEWADNFGKPNLAICGMCPTNNNQPYVPHFENVKDKLKKIQLLTKN